MKMHRSNQSYLGQSIPLITLLAITCFAGHTTLGSNPFSSRTPTPWYLEPKKAPNPLETFRVSQVGADKTVLLRVFQTVKALEEAKHRKSSSSFEILQRLSPTEFLVYRMRIHYSVSAGGSASIGGGGGVSGSSTLTPNRAQLFLLRTRSPLNAADGELIHNIVVSDTGQVSSYAATLGNLRSVRILEEESGGLAPEQTFTQEEFIRRLRSGETWTLESFEEEECRVCFGRGELSAFKGGGICPQCGDTEHKGKGFVDYLIRW